MVEDSIFAALIRDICDRPDCRDITNDKQEILRRSLRDGIEERLKPRLADWIRNGGMTEVSVIYSLPANPNISESSETYERIVYGAAKNYLHEQGFFLEEKECRWYYRPQ